MAITTGLHGRASNRPAAISPSLINLLPASGTQLRARVEPRLAELVGSVVASLRAAGLTPIPVTDTRGRHWAPAYVLGTLDHESPLAATDHNIAVAEVVVDGSGRLVRNHPVQVVGNAHRLLPVGCPCLADRYEEFIRLVRSAEEPCGDAMVLTRHGDLMIAGPGPEPVALADYLNTLALTAAKRAAVHRQQSAADIRSQQAQQPDRA